jgi:hypothetical protein
MIINMESINDKLFKNERLSSDALHKIIGGSAPSTMTICQSNTCDQQSGCNDTQHVSTDDQGKVISDSTTIYCE